MIHQLDGRVKPLHPKIHGGILALRDDPAHQADMKKYGIEPMPDNVKPPQAPEETKGK